VFDVANLIKDGWVMPMAFQHGRQESSPQQFRGALLEMAQEEEEEEEVLDHLFTFLSSAVKKLFKNMLLKNTLLKKDSAGILS
jgi:CRISPR-associated protein Cas1